MGGLKRNEQKERRGKEKRERCAQGGDQGAAGASDEPAAGDPRQGPADHRAAGGLGRRRQGQPDQRADQRARPALLQRDHLRRHAGGGAALSLPVSLCERDPGKRQDHVLRFRLDGGLRAQVYAPRDHARGIQKARARRQRVRAPAARRRLSGAEALRRHRRRRAAQADARAARELRDRMARDAGGSLAAPRVQAVPGLLRILHGKDRSSPGTFWTGAGRAPRPSRRCAC